MSSEQDRTPSGEIAPHAELESMSEMETTRRERAATPSRDGDPLAALSAMQRPPAGFVPPKVRNPWDPQPAGEEPPEEVAPPAAVPPSRPRGSSGKSKKPQTRAQREAQYRRQAAKTQAYQFKKFLAPVCACVGVLLLLMGMAAVLQLMAVLPRPEKVLYSYIFLSGFPMGIMLIFGAVLFFNDVKRHELAEADARAELEGQAGDEG